MAKARMLHKKISVSSQVNRLSLEAQILFTWAIAHADDDGRMRGDPDVISALVVPMKRWSDEKIMTLLGEIKEQKLINYWENNNSWFIEFPTWKEHQYIQKDRYIASKLPPCIENVTSLDTTRIQRVSKKHTQENISESNPIEVNKSEYKEDIADKKTFKSTKDILDPNRYMPKNPDEVAAKETWQKWEPNNPRAFYSTYLCWARKGLPASYFYQITSEMKQSKPRNPGAVFNMKAKAYFEKHGLKTK